MASQPPPSYFVATQAQLAPISMHNGRTRRRYLAQIKITSILHLIGGPLLVLFGIMAIVFRAYWSYYATPIWTGLVIFVLTGILGLWAGSTQKRDKMAGYITMSIIAATAATTMVFVYSFAASLENGHDDYYDPVCQPGGWNTHEHGCYGSGSRIALDALIVVTAFFEMVVSIISASVGGCFACSCCKTGCDDACNCCAPSPTSNAAVISNNSGVIATSDMQQRNGVFLQGGLQTSGQPNAYYVVQQTPGQTFQQAGPIQQVPLQTFSQTSNVQPGNSPQIYVAVPGPAQPLTVPHQAHPGQVQQQAPAIQTSVPPPQVLAPATVQMSQPQPYRAGAPIGQATALPQAYQAPGAVALIGQTNPLPQPFQASGAAAVAMQPKN